METKSIRVRIYGIEYPLKVDDEQQTTKAALTIDRMMADLHTQIPDQPPVTLAVLSALTVSETLYHEQQQTSQILHGVQNEIQSLTLLLDNILTRNT